MASREPGKVITIMNMKGGVGKTTTSIQLSTMLAGENISNKHKRILVIDYDPQFNLSQSLLSPDQYKSALNDGKTMLSVLQEEKVEIDICQLQRPMSLTPPNVDCLTTQVISKRGWILDIIPSTLDLMPLAVSSSTIATDIMSKRFRNMIEEAKSRYDVILIDCHPSGSLFTKTAIICSQHIVIPVTPSPYAERGVSLMKAFIKDLFYGEQSPKLHILLNKISSKSEERAFHLRFNMNDRYKKDLLSSKMSDSKLYAEVVGGNGFLYLSKKPNGNNIRHEMNTLIKELLAKIGGA